MNDELGRLLDQLVRQRISRREFISRAVALGLSAGAAGTILAACGGGTATPAATTTTAAATTTTAAATATSAATETATAAGTASPTATSAAATGLKPASDQTLVVGLQEEPATFDPGINWDYGGVSVEPQVYEGLMRAWRGTTESILEPDLADSYEISTDELKYTFKLKSGIKFSDGSPLTSDDVKFTFERTKSINQGPAILFEAMDTIEAPDPQTVVINLKHKFALFLRALASPWGPGIVNKKVVMAHEQSGDLGQAWLRANGAGSGPYTMETWDEARKQVVLNRNKDWWRGWDSNPHLDKVICRWITEQAQQRLLLEQGDLDVAVGLTPEDFDAVKQEQGIAVQENLGSRMQYMKYNLTKKPYDNLKVRQAMNHALDCDQIINGILNGHARKMDSVIQKGLAGWAPASTQYDFSLDKAKQLLGEAGLSNGFNAGELAWISGNDWGRAAMELYQSDLAKIGVQASIREVPIATWFEIINDASTTPEISQSSGLGPDYADAFELLNLGYGSSVGPFDNFGRYKNDQVDQLLTQAQETLDDTARFAIYKQIIDLVAADAPAAWCIQLNELVAMRQTVQSWEYSFLLTKAFMPFSQMWKSA
ncbi:MAG: ABC transporter substrate-binding protein [Chloroflexi bacterium]|nr:ABC transporter substrate-binding protein [Chloroflexota bacterium]